MDISVWILGDQLLDNHPALARAQAIARDGNIRVLLVESQSQLQRRRHHRKKLVLLLSAMRHYADEIQTAGYEVDYRRAANFTTGIQDHLAEYNVDQLVTMAANSWHGRRFQERLSQQLRLPVTIEGNSQFIASRVGYMPTAPADKRLTQEAFYRVMREKLQLLLTDDGEPVGGQWNYDEQNREPWPADLNPPDPTSFEPDAITLEVMEKVQSLPNGHGSLAGFDLAVRRAQARRAAEDFFQSRLRYFGTYEDAMSAEQELLYHSKLSPYLNLGLLDPLALAQQAEQHFEQGDAPLNSVEGFIRQLVGWREYINWQYWRTIPAIKDQNYFQATGQLPDFYWSGQTDMNCLRHVLGRAVQSGYNHHIERLMILSNYCLLTGVHPMQVFNWFMANYIDAYDWVMAPNVLGMGLFADGGLTSTKPYAASANYINKMSDYCQNCNYFRSKRVGENTCPFNSLYWNFIIEHEEKLRENPRMGTSLLGLRHFDKEHRLEIQAQANEHIASVGIR